MVTSRVQPAVLYAKVRRIAAGVPSGGNINAVLRTSTLSIAMPAKWIFLAGPITGAHYRTQQDMGIVKGLWGHNQPKIMYPASTESAPKYEAPKTHQYSERDMGNEIT